MKEAAPRSIRLVTLVAAPEGVGNFHDAHPDVAAADDQQGRSFEAGGSVGQRVFDVRAKSRHSLRAGPEPTMAFQVTVQPSGRTFTVERDEPILSAAIRQGIGLPYGCKDGACGSCKSRLVEGRVIHGAHQSKALSAEEEAGGWTLTCQATPQTDVVIEARTRVVGIHDAYLDHRFLLFQSLL